MSATPAEKADVPSSAPARVELDETITDPAAIRACDEPDERGERGDFPCCTDRTHKESLGGDSESGTYNRSNRPPAGPCADERTAPAPSSGAGLDLDALHETICDKFTGMAEVRQAADLLVAEVRRLAALCIPLTDLAQELDLSRQNLHHSRAMSSAHFERAEREKARAESAEAEVVTLRARLAAVEALVNNGQTVGWIERDGDVAWIAADAIRAALAVTTGEGQ